mgnify:CR=1 FL=1
MLLKELDFKLPQDLIALYPKKPRDESKLILVEDEFKIIEFKEIIDFLKPNDALVFNNTKVINANLLGNVKKRKVVVNLNKIIDQDKVIWSVFIKSNKRPEISDQMSTNGTVLNGELLESHKPNVLVDGDEIVVGKTSLLFKTAIK